MIQLLIKLQTCLKCFSSIDLRTKLQRKNTLSTGLRLNQKERLLKLRNPLSLSMVIEQNKTQLVVIAHDVDQIELVVGFPALCRKMEIPYCIVQGKAQVEEVASALCLTTVNNEDKMEFSKILE